MSDVRRTFVCVMVGKERLCSGKEMYMYKCTRHVNVIEKEIYTYINTLSE